MKNNSRYSLKRRGGWTVLLKDGVEVLAAEPTATLKELVAEYESLQAQVNEGGDGK